MSREKEKLAAVEATLYGLKGERLKPRIALTEEEKDALVAQVGGPKTTRQLLRAKKELPLARIPFLFSTIDSQAVVDVLANDMEAAIARAESRRQPRKSSSP